MFLDMRPWRTCIVCNYQKPLSDYEPAPYGPGSRATCNDCLRGLTDQWARAYARLKPDVSRDGAWEYFTLELRVATARGGLKYLATLNEIPLEGLKHYTQWYDLQAFILAQGWELMAAENYGEYGTRGENLTFRRARE